jgi:integrase
MGRSKYRSAAAVAKLKAPGRYAVGDGVQLQISKWHTKAWVFRYERFGRPHYMGLGPCDLISLAEARAKGREARRLLLDGVDPLALKRQKRNEAALRQAREQTFEACARAYITAHDAGWSRASSAQWIASLERYVFPLIGKLPVSEIDLPLVLKVLEPIWLTVSETASRIRGRIEAILGWATVRGLRTGDNPARWSSHLEHLLPSQAAIRQKERHAALPYKDVGAFMAKLRAEEGVPARALEFLILTAARTAEVLGARWDEIDGDMWTVPAERMKGRVEHRVPLSKRAIKLLAELPRQGDFVFIGGRGARMDKMSLHRVLTRLECNTTVHGFRSTFRDWAADTTGYANHVVEKALAHTIPNAVEAAYRRGLLFEKRRRLMQDWADYCGRARVDADVVPLRKEVL